jgi:hypothetical protein
VAALVGWLSDGRPSVERVYDARVPQSAATLLSEPGLSSSSSFGEAVAELAPDSVLARVLEGTDHEKLDDFSLVEVVAAWRRVGAWAAARAAAAAARLAERPAMNPDWPTLAGRVAETCVAGDELALRLGVSRRSGRELVEAGRAFTGPLWPTGEALERGEIDEGKARIVRRALARVPLQVAADVQERLLPSAPSRTHTQLARDLERALIVADPVDAAERSARAVADRCISTPKPLADGMAGLWAVLPAPAAVALSRRLDQVARGARADGDPGTLDQLRADTLCTAVLRPAAVPVAEDGTDEAVAGDGVAVPGELGPSDGGKPSLASRLARQPLRTELRVTVPLDTLLGGSDAPAELEGYGAISSVTARALARDGTWRRLVTDPQSGALLDVGRTRYRPPADLDEHVRIRDGSCVQPRCTTPASRCDLDHTIPFDAPSDGDTSAANLNPLCRTDHLLKTHAGFQLVQVAPGVFEWTTPTGHRYLQRPEGLPPPPG